LYFFEDFEVGQTFESKERQVLQQDIQSFANLTGDYNRLHLDQEYAEKSMFKERIAHGMLTLSLSLGLWHSLGLTNETVIAFVELDHAIFHSPIFPGDSILLRSEVLSKRESKSRPEAGLVTWKDQVINTKRGNQLALDYERTFMLRKKAK
jgi:3-hydroxybutyryl-CoA dehydratase